jgi:tRNA A37 methylthiotransferase MiaB
MAQIIIRSCDRRVLELEQVKAWFEGNGFKLSHNHTDVDPRADVIILTTCGVTQLHEDFAFEMLDKIKVEKKPGARVILGGCVPEIDPKRVSEEFGGPTFSPQSYSKLDEIFPLPHKLNEFGRPNTYDMRALYRSDVGNIIRYARSFRGHYLDFKYIARRFSLSMETINRRRRTYLIQIHEGCSMGCTYCAIQKAIGPLRNSKPIDVVVDELNKGLDKGYKRIRLIGDSAGSYGLDIRTNLGALLSRISQIDRDFNLELTDINPAFLTVIFEPVKVLCTQKRLSSLYIPIQSANERILTLMHRRSDMKKNKQMFIGIREVAPTSFKLGTSVIVGFPSETAEEFQETIDFCNDVNFDWIWCHGFSSRPGTPAATLPGQLSEEEILERVNLFKASVKNKGSAVTDLDLV